MYTQYSAKQLLLFPDIKYYFTLMLKGFCAIRILFDKHFVGWIILYGTKIILSIFKVSGLSTFNSFFSVSLVI
jgi:hypothetical protein